MTDAITVRRLIETAFAGVRLEDGVSLKQARAYDGYLEGISKAAFDALPKGEVTDDWQAIEPPELDDNPCLAFLDEKGFR